MSENTEPGQLLRRALDLRALIKAGLNITLDEIDADEMYAILVTEEEQDRLERDQAQAEQDQARADEMVRKHGRQ